jgi:hypothetical protein
MLWHGLHSFAARFFCAFSLHTNADANRPPHIEALQSKEKPNFMNKMPKDASAVIAPHWLENTSTVFRTRPPEFRKARRRKKKSKKTKPPLSNACQQARSPPDWINLQSLFSEKEAAAILGISVDTLRRLGDAGPKRRHPSPGRVAYKLGEVLAVADAA